MKQVMETSNTMTIEGVKVEFKYKATTTVLGELKEQMTFQFGEYTLSAVYMLDMDGEDMYCTTTNGSEHTWEVALIKEDEVVNNEVTKIFGADCYGIMPNLTHEGIMSLLKKLV